MFSNYESVSAMPGTTLQDPIMLAPTSYPPVPTTTVEISQDEIDAIDARLQYCPISDEDYARGITEGDLPPVCSKLIVPYCYVNVSTPVRSSTRFPAVCTPSYPTTTTESSASATPTSVSPILPGTVEDCESYYQVVTDGETCYAIEQRFDITADQVRSIPSFMV